MGRFKPYYPAMLLSFIPFQCGGAHVSGFLKANVNLYHCTCIHQNMLPILIIKQIYMATQLTHRRLQAV